MSALKIVITLTITHHIGYGAAHETIGSGTSQGEFEELQD
jgi:hypothetical protein